MKKTMFISALLVATTSFAQLRYTIHYDVVTTQRGELYQYSERYLGTKDVVMEDETSYRLTDITIPDTAKKVKHVLPQCTGEGKGLLLPLSEEALMATNTAKKAECIARQIYRIREARINLLAGEVEHVPADGQAMRLVLAKMDEQEKQLTSMFIGVTTVSHQQKTISFQLDTDAEESYAQDTVIARFSKWEGPVEHNNLGGEPIWLHLDYHVEPVVVSAPQKRNEEPVIKDEWVGTDLRLSFQGKTILTQTVRP